MCLPSSSMAPILPVYDVLASERVSTRRCAKPKGPNASCDAADEQQTYRFVVSSREESLSVVVAGVSLVSQRRARRRTAHVCPMPRSTVRGFPVAPADKERNPDGSASTRCLNHPLYDVLDVLGHVSLCFLHEHELGCRESARPQLYEAKVSRKPST